MISFRDLLALMSLASLSHAAFQQTNYYDQASCGGKTPIVAITQSYPSCTVAQCAANAWAQYQVEETICSETDPLVLTGSVRNYVSQQIFVNSENCEGNVTSSIAVAADALCHPMPNDNTHWMKVNCNGGQPIYNYCWDAGCGNCTTYQYLNNCNLMSAGVSMKVVCNPAGSTTDATGSIHSTSASTGENSDSSGAISISQTFFAGSIGAFLLMLNFL